MGAACQLAPGARCRWGGRHARAQPAPEALCGVTVRGEGAWEGPLTFYIRSPWCGWHRWPGHYTAGRAPRGPLHGDLETHTHVHTSTRVHAHAHEVVCPSIHPCQVSGLGHWAPVVDGVGWGPLPHQEGSACGLQPSRLRAPTAGWGRRQELVGKHGVVPRGAGAGRVLAAGRVLLKGHRQVQVFLWAASGQRFAHPHRGCSPSPQGTAVGSALTSVDVTVRMRSRSSTSCLKVGLCEGTACQHSRMIMYLGARGSGECPLPTHAQPVPMPHLRTDLAGHWPLTLPRVTA